MIGVIGDADDVLDHEPLLFFSCIIFITDIIIITIAAIGVQLQGSSMMKYAHSGSSDPMSRHFVSCHLSRQTG